MKSPYAKVNRALKSEHVTLRKGRGYLYFTFDDGQYFDTMSIYWNDFSDRDVKYLVSEGREFAAQCRWRAGPSVQTTAIRVI